MKKIIQFNKSSSNTLYENQCNKSKKENCLLPTLQEDRRKKWMQAIDQTNQEVQIMRVIHCANSSEKNLIRLGSSHYSMNTQQPQSLTKHNPTPPTTTPISLLKSLSNSNTILKKIRKQATIPKSQQNKNISYYKERISLINLQNRNKESIKQEQRLVYRIGINMQNVSKLKQQHITKIFKNNASGQNIVPMIYCIKDQNQCFVPSPLEPKNDQIPICVCLYTESLDPKIEKSILKRSRYIEALRNKMNGTYDPQILGHMKTGNFTEFNVQAYQRALLAHTQKLDIEVSAKLQAIVAYIQEQLAQIYPHSKSKFLELKNQILHNYQNGNSISKLDYYLLNKQNKATLQKILKSPIQHYLYYCNSNINSLKINYHGGYSKHHYSNWHIFYNTSKQSLQKNLNRYTEKIQHMNSWLQNFTHINLIQVNYFKVRGKTIGLHQFYEVQSIRLSNILEFLRSVWSSGVYSIMMDKYLKKFDRKVKKIVFQEPSKMFYWEQKQWGISEKEELVHYNNVILEIIKKSKFKKLLILPACSKNLKYKCLNSQSTFKCIEILLNIFYEQLITKSLNTYIEMIMKSSEPLFTLDLIVDRQTLKFKQNQEKVVNQLIAVLEKLLVFKFKINQNLEELDNNGSQQVQDYEMEQNSSSRLGTDGSFSQPTNLPIFHIFYKYRDMHTKTISKFTNFIRQNYRQAQQILQKFSSFMPFIKLTAKDKIFMQQNTCQSKQEWKIAEELFTKNLNYVDSYREQLAKIPQINAMGIFQVNCREPLKLLNDRLNQLEYMSEQKYLNKVYQKIHEHEQQIARIMTISHCNNITAENMDEVLYKFDIFIKQLNTVKVNMKDLAYRIYFYASRKPKSTTLILRYQQLITKRNELLDSIKQLKQKAIYDCIMLQKQFNELQVSIIKQISSFQQKLQSILQQYFDLSKIDNYLKKIQDLKYEYNQCRNKITPELLKNLDINKIDLLTNKIDILYKYWACASKFFSHSKILHLQSLNEINLAEYQIFIQECEHHGKLFKEIFSKQEYKEHNWLIAKLERDLEKFKSMSAYLKLLGTVDIPFQYFEEFGCQEFRGINFKKLLMIQNINRYLKDLEEMATKAACQNYIHQQYKQIESLMKSLKVRIVDYNGNDSIDRDHTRQLIQTMNSSNFRCKDLLQKKYCHKYQKQISKLKSRIRKCCEIMGSWLCIQKQYFTFEEFYRNNDDAEDHLEFKSISILYKKVIKSFDIDDSIWFVPKNQYFIKSKDAICQSVLLLKRRLFAYFAEIKSDNPRLYMLTHEQLLAVMSNIQNIPKYIPKCLPSIDSISIQGDSIQRIGGSTIKYITPQKQKKNEYFITGNYVLFQQPLQVGARLAQLHTWLQKLRTMIETKLKNDYLHFQIKNNPCLQVTLLKLQINFTSEIEQIYGGTESTRTMDRLQTLQKSLTKKIQKHRKQLNQTTQYQNQIKILTLVLQRETLKSLQRTPTLKNSYQWLKTPKYYDHSENAHETHKRNQVDLRVQIMHHVFRYGFMFVEDCSLSGYRSVSVFQNYLIGSCGNILGLRSLAYMTGNQLFVHKEKELSPTDIENIIYYFKINVSCGSWLVFPNLHALSQTCISVIAECLRTVNNAINASRIKFFNCKPLQQKQSYQFFFTSDFYESRFDNKLKNYLKPQWILKPNPSFLHKLHSQVYNPDSQPTGQYPSKPDNLPCQSLYKILQYFHWYKTHQTLPLQFFKGIKNYFQGTFSKNREIVVQNRFLDNLLGVKFVDLWADARFMDVQGCLKNVGVLVCYCDFEVIQGIVRGMLAGEILVLRDIEHIKGSLHKYFKNRLTHHTNYLIIQNGLQFHPQIQQTLSQIPTTHPKLLYLQNYQSIMQESLLRYSTNLPTIELSPNSKSSLLNKQIKPIKHPCEQAATLKEGKKVKKGKKKITFKEMEDQEHFQYCKMLANQKNSLGKGGLSEDIRRLYEEFKVELGGLYALGDRQKMESKFVQMFCGIHKRKQGYSQASIFMFLLAWLYANYVPEDQIKEWLVSKNLLINQEHCHIRSLSRLQPKTEQTPTPTNNFFQNLLPLRSTFPHLSYLLSNTNHHNQPISPLILSPPACKHIHPEQLNTISDIKQLLDHINYNIHKKKQSPIILLQKDGPKLQQDEQCGNQFVQIVVHSMEYLLKKDEELGNLVVELARRKSVLVEIDGEIENLDATNCVFILQYIGDLQICASSNLMHIRINEADLKQIQMQTLSDYFSDHSHSLNLQKLHKMLSNPSFPPLPHQTPHSLTNLLKNLYITLKIQQYPQPLQDFPTRISQILKPEHYPQLIQKLTKQLSNYELARKNRLCKMLMEICSTFNLHLYLFNLVSILYEAIQIAHCVVYGPVDIQLPYVTELISALLGTPIFNYQDYYRQYQSHQSHQFMKISNKKLLRIYEQDLTQQNMLHIEGQLNKQNSPLNTNYTILCYLKNPQQSYKNTLLTYPNLLNKFLHISSPQQKYTQIHKIIDLQQTLKLLDQNQNQLVFCMINKWDKPTELYEGKCIVEYFHRALGKGYYFMMEFYEIRKEIEEMEFSKYKFYRSLTEQMFDHISELQYKLKGIPSHRKHIESQLQKIVGQTQKTQQQINIKEIQLRQLTNGMNLLVNTLQKNIQTLQDRQVSVNRHKKQFNPLFDKLYDRIENLSISESSKLKNKTDSQLMNTIKQFITNILTYKNKIAPIKQLRNMLKENPTVMEKNMEQIHRLAQQIKSENKSKIDKYGLVYRLLADWIVLCDTMQSKILDEIRKIQQTRQKQKTSMQNLQLRIQSQKGLLQTLSSKLQDEKTKLTELQELQQQCRQKLSQFSASEDRIKQILTIIREKQYKNKISKDLAEWLFYAPKTIMRKVIRNLTLNQYEAEPFFVQSLFYKHFKGDQRPYSLQPDIFDFVEYGLTENTLIHNIFGENGILSDQSAEIQELIDSPLQNHQKKESSPQFDIQIAQILLSISLCPKQIQVIEDKQFYLKQALIQKYQKIQNTLILEQANHNVSWLIATLKTKLNLYKNIVVIGIGFVDQVDIREFFGLLDQILINRSRIQTKLVFLLRSIDKEYKISMQRFISVRRVKISMYGWARMYGRLAINSQFLKWQLPFKQSQLKYNSNIKHLFEKVQNFHTNISDESYHQLITLFAKIQQNQEENEKYRISYEKQLKEFETVGRESSLYYILYCICEQLESSYTISVFQEGTCLQNFLKLLKKLKLSRSSQIDNFQKFCISLCSQIKFINQNYLLFFLMVIYFLITKPPTLTAISILHHIGQLKNIHEEGERFKYIVKMLANRDIEAGEFEAYCQQVENKEEEYIFYFVCGFIDRQYCTPLKLRNKFISKIQDSYKCRVFYNEIYLNSNSFYYNQIKHSKISSNKRPYNSIWLIEAPENSYNSCIEYLESRTLKQSKGQNKLLSMYYDANNQPLFFTKLRELCQNPFHINIFNIQPKMQALTIDKIIQQLCNMKNINPNFRIYIVIHHPINCRLKAYIQYIQYKQQSFKKQNSPSCQIMDSSDSALDGELDKKKYYRNMLVDDVLKDKLEGFLKQTVGKLGLEGDQSFCGKFVGEYCQAFTSNVEERRGVEVSKEAYTKISSKEIISELNRPDHPKNTLIPHNLSLILTSEITSSLKNNILSQNTQYLIETYSNLLKGNFIQIRDAWIFKSIIYICIRAFLADNHPYTPKMICKNVSNVCLALCQSEEGLCFSCEQDRSCWVKLLQNNNNSTETGKYHIIVLENHSSSEIVPIEDLQQLLHAYECQIKLTKVQQEEYLLPIEFWLTKRQ